MHLNKVIDKHFQKSKYNGSSLGYHKMNLFEKYLNLMLIARVNSVVLMDLVASSILHSAQPVTSSLFLLLNEHIPRQEIFCMS